jgi:hypothetical protein
LVCGLADAGTLSQELLDCQRRGLSLERKPPMVFKRRARGRSICIAGRTLIHEIRTA